MFKLRSFALALIAVCCFPAFSADLMPSEESIRELLAVTQVRKQIDGVMTHVEGLMNTAMQQMLSGRPVTPDQRRIMESMQSKGMALLREELSWESYEPFFVAIYQQHLTQEEVNGMLGFYKSPLGRAVIDKMPVLMQVSAAESQKRMGPLMEKIKRLSQETYGELQSVEKR